MLFVMVLMFYLILSIVVDLNFGNGIVLCKKCPTILEPQYFISAVCC